MPEFRRKWKWLLPVLIVVPFGFVIGIGIYIWDRRRKHAGKE